MWQVQVLAPRDWGATERTSPQPYGLCIMLALVPGSSTSSFTASVRGHAITRKAVYCVGHRRWTRLHIGHDIRTLQRRRPLPQHPSTQLPSLLLDIGIHSNALTVSSQVLPAGSIVSGPKSLHSLACAPTRHYSSARIVCKRWAQQHFPMAQSLHEQLLSSVFGWHSRCADPGVSELALGSVGACMRCSST